MYVMCGSLYIVGIKRLFECNYIHNPSPNTASVSAVEDLKWNSSFLNHSQQELDLRRTAVMADKKFRSLSAA